MPIGTIIGWLVGQFIIGFLLWTHNNEHKRNMSEISSLTRQVVSGIGLILAYTSIFAFVGTTVELALR